MISRAGLVNAAIEGTRPPESYWVSLSSMGNTVIVPSLHDVIEGEHYPATILPLFLFFIGMCVMLPSIFSKQSVFLIAGSATIVGSSLIYLTYQQIAPLSPEKQRTLLDAIERTIEKYNALYDLHYRDRCASIISYRDANATRIRDNIKQLREALPSVGSTQFDPSLPPSQPARPFPHHNKL